MSEDMENHIMLMGISIGLVAFLVVSMIPLSEGDYGEGARSITQPQEMVYINGDWNVTTDTIRSNETIVLSGNLTVSNNASLTFKNVTLIMNCTSAGQYIIEVQSGSSMYILDLDNNNVTRDDASNITAVDSNYPYLFWVDDGTHFEMRNSEIHRCGGFGIAGISPVTKTFGLYIATDNATIYHNLISNNYYGIVLYGSDATVSNNTITWNDRTGIEATVYSNATIENNWITGNGVYGIDINGWDNTHGPWPSNPTVTGNVITDTGRGVNTAIGITVDYSCKPLIRDTLILRSTEDGFYSGESSTPILINVTIDGGNYGIASSATKYIYVYNTTISNTKLYDLSIQGAPGSFFIVTNSTFNESKVIIDSSGNLTVRWYLHVYVEDKEGTPIPSANVRIKDNDNGNYDKNFTTDDNGYVKWIVLKEYWANKTTKIYYTPYNITVNYSGLNFTDNPRDTNMNTSKTEVFRATSTVPEFGKLLLPFGIALIMGLFVLRRRKERSSSGNCRVMRKFK
jgi:parallel beta-helix repeat protein